MSSLRLFIVFNLLFFFNTCDLSSQSEKTENIDTKGIENTESNESVCEEFTRDSIISKIKHKKAMQNIFVTGWFGN